MRYLADPWLHHGSHIGSLVPRSSLSLPVWESIFSYSCIQENQPWHQWPVVEEGSCAGVRELAKLLRQLSELTGKRETHLWNFLESSPAFGNPSAVSAHLPCRGRKADHCAPCHWVLLSWALSPLPSLQVLVPELAQNCPAEAQDKGPCVSTCLFRRPLGATTPSCHMGCSSPLESPCVLGPEPRVQGRG